MPKLRSVLRRALRLEAVWAELNCKYADYDQLDSIRTGCESAKVLARVVITGEIEIVTWLVTEKGLRRGQGLRRRDEYSKQTAGQGVSQLVS